MGCGHDFITQPQIVPLSGFRFLTFIFNKYDGSAPIKYYRVFILGGTG